MANKDAGAAGQTEEWEDHNSTPSYNQWHNWYYSQSLYPYHSFEPLPSTSASPPQPPNWFGLRSKLTSHPRSNDHASERPEKENCDRNFGDTGTETVSLKSGHYLELLNYNTELFLPS